MKINQKIMFEAYWKLNLTKLNSLQMKTWKPITLALLQNEIDNGVQKMTTDQLILWKNISIEPKKWLEVEYGNEGGGFWVVAVKGNEIVYYNDIEEGFNVSTFTKVGLIDAYQSEQDELQWALNKLK